ncbi:MAG: hypothetical protein PUP92_12920 [Rhizonema sp. PD38]|nr:hypothetical protein [Rhizonema sp. PD38]
MTERFRKHSVEINDLIGDAINNALVRRNQAIDSQDTLSALSNEEETKVVGGLVTSGIIYYPQRQLYDENRIHIDRQAGPELSKIPSPVILEFKLKWKLLTKLHFALVRDQNQQIVLFLV